MPKVSTPHRLRFCASIRDRSRIIGRSIKNRAPRGALLVALLLTVSGCSTTKTAYLPPDEASLMSGWGEDITLVKPGMIVTITLKSGKKVKGEVVEVTPEEIVLGKAGNYGYQKDPYAAEDIDKIEFGKPTGSANFFAGVAVGFSLMFAILAIGLAVSGPVNLS